MCKLQIPNPRGSIGRHGHGFEDEIDEVIVNLFRRELVRFYGPVVTFDCCLIDKNLSMVRIIVALIQHVHDCVLYAAVALG